MLRRGFFSALVGSAFMGGTSTASSINSETANELEIRRLEDEVVKAEGWINGYPDPDDQFTLEEYENHELKEIYEAIKNKQIIGTTREREFVRVDYPDKDVLNGRATGRRRVSFQYCIGTKEELEANPYAHVCGKDYGVCHRCR